MIQLRRILLEVNWNRVDDGKISKSKMGDVKSSKVLRRETVGGYTYYLTDYMSDFDDVFLGQIFVFNDKQFIGELGIAKWNGESDKYLEGLVSVHPDFRRKGVATHMYNMGEKYFNKKFKQAPSSTSDAKKFWKNRDKFS